MQAHNNSMLTILTSIFGYLKPYFSQITLGAMILSALGLIYHEGKVSANSQYELVLEKQKEKAQQLTNSYQEQSDDIAQKYIKMLDAINYDSLPTNPNKLPSTSPNKPRLTENNRQQSPDCKNAEIGLDWAGEQMQHDRAEINNAPSQN